MVLVFLQYIEYEITDVSVVFIGEFRAWRTDKTEYSLFPEGKFEIGRLTEANSIGSLRNILAKTGKPPVTNRLISGKPHWYWPRVV
jgi:hypothetical protein